MAKKKKAKHPFTNLSDVLLEFMEDSVNKMTENLRRARNNQGANASGALSQSIGENLQDGIKTTPKGMTLEISMLPYGTNVDEGRKPGTLPPVSNILEWVRNKPNLVPRPDKLGNVKSDEEIAEDIAWGIKWRGIEPTDFYSDVINKKQQKQLFKDIDKAIGLSLIHI